MTSKWTTGQEKVLNITNHQGSANQNDNETPPHTCQNGYYQKTTNNKCWWGYGGKEILVHCWWEYKQMQPLRKTIWRFHKSFKIELPYDPAISFLGICSTKIKTLNSERYMHPYVHCSIIYNSQDMEAICVQQ